MERETESTEKILTCELFIFVSLQFDIYLIFLS